MDCTTYLALTGHSLGDSVPWGRECLPCLFSPSFLEWGDLVLSAFPEGYCWPFLGQK